MIKLRNNHIYLIYLLLVFMIFGGSYLYMNFLLYPNLSNKDNSIEILKQTWLLFTYFRFLLICLLGIVIILTVKSYFLKFFLLLTLCIECYFNLTSFTTSGPTYPMLNWYVRYWYPVNSNQFRDFDINKKDSARQVLIIGDSYTAGLGIENIEDRYDKILQKLFNNKYKVNILAQPGYNTTEEIAALSNQNIKCRSIIIQYYINDI